MPYIATIHDKTYQIEPAIGDQEGSVTLQGARYTIDWQRVASLAVRGQQMGGTGGRSSLIIAGMSYDVFARRLDKPDEGESQTYEILIGDQRFEVQVEDERAKALIGTIKSASDSGEAMIRAPMPGLVIGTPVEAGAEVARGQTVIVLEAMKMENDLAAPRAGTIKEVRVSKGQTVNQGDILVVIEA
ncbi:MAG: acetyl-CoA carboxylase biotin carboxyl carrier protein subunit [Chloroflexota bacterium]|nr:acetyl-CoA carboxylase biotin carboxyl carrier protein subunit [Chloroflexota bacterium]